MELKCFSACDHITSFSECLLSVVLHSSYPAEALQDKPGELSPL